MIEDRKSDLAILASVDDLEDGTTSSPRARHRDRPAGHGGRRL